MVNDAATNPATMDSISTMVVSPPPLPSRPRLWGWMRLRGIELRPAAKALGVSHTHVWQLGLPFDDPRRVEPSPEMLAAICAWTGEPFTAADFYPPHLSGPSALAPAEDAQRPACAEEPSPDPHPEGADA